MRSDEDRKEHGSDFAYPELDEELLAITATERGLPWLPQNASFWHSGRHALRALVQTLKPARVFFPSFYCQDVLDAVEPFEVRCYADGPTDDMVDVSSIEDLRAGDLFVVTNTYGTRRTSPIRETLPAGVVVVEDHTHDPLSKWARTSSAPYAFASLRKWFPLPDGGVVWSPQSRPEISAVATSSMSGVSSVTSAAMTTATLDRLSGMLLKQRYLAGDKAITKELFRARSIAGEEAIGRGEPTSMSPVARALLDTLPSQHWHERRAQNHHVFVTALGSLANARVISRDSEVDGEAVPFSIVLLFNDAGDREKARAALVAARIYPAVLWPIDASRAAGIPAEHVDLSQRVLCLHCDHRYDATEMQRVAETVRQVIRRDS